MTSGAREFVDFVNDLLKTRTSLNCEWVKEDLTIRFKKKSGLGFDIVVDYDPLNQLIGLQTDRGYHDHWHVNRFDAPIDAFETVFGLVRDLLANHMRIEEIQSNGNPRKWRLQAYRRGKWETEASMGLLAWNFFGKKTIVHFSNEILPPREMPD